MGDLGDLADTRFTLEPAPGGRVKGLEEFAAESALRHEVSVDDLAAAHIPHGPPPDDEDAVTADSETVAVVVLVEPPVGDQECPSNPSFPVVVDFGEPLGDRTVLDAGTSPPEPSA